MIRGLVDWLDDRTGIRRIRHRLLDEPLPPGTGWWFTLGSLLLFGLGVQVVTGVTLALYYAPTPDHAWDSVRYITSTVRGGSFLRGLHHWGASIVVIAALAHLLRVVFFGSYRRPREVNWILGVLLLFVILAFGLTGYLLPWDQRAYWATVVTINISRLTPLAGNAVAALLAGGAEIGALTLTRWYAMHVLVLPVLLVSLVVAHLYLMRRHGISGPIRPREGPARPFFPYQMARDLTVSLAVGLVWAVLAWRGAPALEAPADPSSSDYVPRPEWYFLGLFQLLKYFPGRYEVIGAIVIPGLAAAALMLLPWLDRGATRAWRSRRIVLATFTAAFAGVAGLTLLGMRDRPATTLAPGAWHLREIAGAEVIATDRCVRCHAEDRVAPPIVAGRIGQTRDWLTMHVADPEVLAAGLRVAPATNKEENAAIVAALTRMRTTAPPTTDAPTKQIALLITRNCIECHTIDGVGGKDGPELTKVGEKQTAESIESRLWDPFSVDVNASMPSFADTLTAEEIKTLATWLSQRK